jgi:hypothetical protein
VAVAVDGRTFSWGDSDGGALGQPSTTCDAPAWLGSLRGLHAVHASVSYTNGAVATSAGRVFVWGGNAWEGGIAEGRTVGAAPTEVVWGGVPACYTCAEITMYILGEWYISATLTYRRRALFTHDRCSAVALAHQHGLLVFRKGAA